MVDRRRVIIAVFVLAAAAGLWWLLKRPSAEERIRAQLDALCRLVSKEPGEGTAQAAFKGLALPPLFANPVEIRGDAGPFVGRHTPSELASLAVRVRSSLDAFDLATTDLTIEVRPPGEADIRFTGRVKSGADVTYRQIAAHLRRVEGTWVFSSFNVVNVMKGQ